MYKSNPSHEAQTGQILSPGTDAWASDVSVSPEEFFNSTISLAAVCPETALMYAVVEDAFRCFQKQCEIDNLGSQCTTEAEEWFFSDETDDLFSFVGICTALGLDSEFIRKRLKYWRQCHVVLAEPSL